MHLRRPIIDQVRDRSLLKNLLSEEKMQPDNQIDYDTKDGILQVTSIVLIDTITRNYSVYHANDLIEYERGDGHRQVASQVQRETMRRNPSGWTYERGGSHICFLLSTFTF